MVDINISHNTLKYEVQIECKNDYNSNIYNGIEGRLIGKYFSSNVVYGIYLIFYFGKRKCKKQFMNNVVKNMPEKYKNNIEVIVIDLRK